MSTLCASYCVRRTSLVEGGECSAAAASWGRLSNCSRAQFSASFLNCPQLSGSWPGTGHRAVSRTNEGAQFCMLASTRGSVSRVVSPGHVAATLLWINYTFKDSIHCRLQEEDLWQWKDNLWIIEINWLTKFVACHNCHMMQAELITVGILQHWHWQVSALSIQLLSSLWLMTAN